MNMRMLPHLGLTLLAGLCGSCKSDPKLDEAPTRRDSSWRVGDTLRFQDHIFGQILYHGDQFVDTVVFGSMFAFDSNRSCVYQRIRSTAVPPESANAGPRPAEIVLWSDGMQRNLSDSLPLFDPEGSRFVVDTSMSPYRLSYYGFKAAKGDKGFRDVYACQRMMSRTDGTMAMLGDTRRVRLYSDDFLFGFVYGPQPPVPTVSGTVFFMPLYRNDEYLPTFTLVNGGRLVSTLRELHTSHVGRP